jgi:hypothetical protein
MLFKIIKVLYEVNKSIISSDRPKISVISFNEHFNFVNLLNFFSSNLSIILLSFRFKNNNSLLYLFNKFLSVFLFIKKDV